MVPVVNVVFFRRIITLLSLRKDLAPLELFFFYQGTEAYVCTHKRETHTRITPHTPVRDACHPRVVILSSIQTEHEAAGRFFVEYPVAMKKNNKNKQDKKHNLDYCLRWERSCSEIRAR